MAGLLVAAWLISCSPLLYYGYPRGHDWLSELVRVAEYRHAWEAGQAVPYWAENVYGGFGCPVFLFYAPLFCATSAALSYLTGGIVTAVRAALFFISALGAISVAALTNRAAADESPVDPAVGRIAAYIFLLHPYLLGDKLLRNAHAEFTALCLAPLVLLGLLEAKRDSRKGALILAMGLGLTVLAHNLTALTFAALIAGYALLVLLSASRWRTVLAIAAGGGLGLGLSAFFWMPAFCLRNFVDTDELLSGKFDFHNQFVSLGEIFSYQDFLSIGLLTLLLLACGLAALLIRRGNHGAARRPLAGAWLAGVFFLFLTLRPSLVLWERIPLMRYFQFPWRMLGPLAVLTAVAGSLTYAILTAGRSARIRRSVELSVFLLCLLNALPTFVKIRPLDRALLSRLPSLLTPDSIRNNGLLLTVRDEYLPQASGRDIWQKERPYAGVALNSPLNENIREVKGSGSRFSFSFDSPRPSVVSLARWNFPGWVTRVNGQPAEPMANSYGTFGLQLPSGRSLVECRYQPPIRRGALLISTLSLILWLFLAGLPILRASAVARRRTCL